MASSARTVPSRLGAALSAALESYADGVALRVNRATEDAAREMVRRTRASAPRGRRKRFYRHIACKAVRTSAAGDQTWAWYVTDPEYRLTHLLENGHATPSGGRTRGLGFVREAFDRVGPEYARRVREAVGRAS